MVDKLNLIDLSKISPTKPSQSQSGGVDPGTGKDFKQLLMDSIGEVNRLQQEAQTATEKLVTGETNNPSEVFSAVRKADIAFSLLMQIRNQLTDAYSEIRNMRL